MKRNVQLDGHLAARCYDVEPRGKIVVNKRVSRGTGGEVKETLKKFKDHGPNISNLDAPVCTRPASRLYLATGEKHNVLW